MEQQLLEKKNVPKLEGLNYQANSDSWGLDVYSLPLETCHISSGSHQNIGFGLLKLGCGLLLLIKDKMLEFVCSLLPKTKILIGKFNPFK